MKTLVAISVEKIQKYIYSVLDDRDVIRQKDKGTLKSIISASSIISKNIDKIIRSKFKISSADEILMVSGKFIFTIEEEKEAVLEKMDRIFKEIYSFSGGKLFINYFIDSIENIDRLEIIREATKKLKDNSSKNNVIIRNSAQLFDFIEVKKESIIYDEKIQLYENVYVKDMDSLVDYKDTNLEGTNGKIAIVKADINNLGDFFNKISNYDEYIEVSRILKNKISLEYFAEILKPNLKDKVLPIYVAGDDIFYAVKMDSVLQSIDALSKIINKVNEELKSDISIAVACIFVSNHQPIRYYRDAVESELSKIKNKMKTKENFKKSASLGLKILDNYFYKEKNKKKIRNENNLNKFIDEISDLKYMMDKGALTNSFIYKLIYDIEHEKNKGMNVVLHNLRPELGLSENSIYNVLIKQYWISFLLGTSKPKNKLIAENINGILLPRLKLTAMLVDEKYNSITFENEKMNENWEGKSNIFNTDKTKIKQNLFNKPLNYFVDNSTKLTRLFLGKEKEIGSKKEVYKKLNLEKACLFKCKKLIDSGKSDLVYDVIINNINIKKVDVKNEQETSEQLTNEQFKSKYLKDFSENRQEFYELMKNSESRWIEDVIIYYEYSKQRTEYLVNKLYGDELQKKCKTKKRTKRETKNTRK